MVNKRVDQIRNEYRNRLNRAQENDVAQVNFMKQSMEKFAKVIGKVGEDLVNKSQSIHDCA